MTPENNGTMLEHDAYLLGRFAEYATRVGLHSMATTFNMLGNTARHTPPSPVVPDRVDESGVFRADVMLDSQAEADALELDDRDPVGVRLGDDEHEFAYTHNRPTAPKVVIVNGVRFVPEEGFNTIAAELLDAAAAGNDKQREIEVLEIRITKLVAELAEAKSGIMRAISTIGFSGLNRDQRDLLTRCFDEIRDGNIGKFADSLLMIEALRRDLRAAVDKARSYSPHERRAATQALIDARASGAIPAACVDIVAHNLGMALGSNPGEKRD